MIFLICSLILFTIGTAGVETTAQGTGLHDLMVAVSLLSVVGALLFLALFERARYQFSGAQLAWAMVPLCSIGFLAPVPFLWLAIARRRVRDWVVFAVYLAATVTVVVALSSVPANASITGLPGVTMPVLLVVAPVHTVLAFSPAARVPAWRDVFPAWAGKREQPVMDEVPLEDRNQAPNGPLKPTLTDSGESTSN
jgi:hypothetical protein